MSGASEGLPAVHHRVQQEEIPIKRQKKTVRLSGSIYYIRLHSQGEVQAFIPLSLCFFCCQVYEKFNERKCKYGTKTNLFHSMKKNYHLKTFLCCLTPLTVECVVSFTRRDIIKKPNQIYTHRDVHSIC